MAMPDNGIFKIMTTHLSKNGLRLLHPQDLRERGIRYTPQHLRRLEHAGKFPRRVKIGHRIHWVEDEIDEYLRAHVNQRESEGAQ